MESRSELIEFRIDDGIERYVESIEFDHTEIDAYARVVGVENHLQRRAEANANNLQPATVNLHSGYYARNSGARTKLRKGILNIYENRYGDMPPADIDIFLGSHVFSSAKKETSKERDFELSDSLNHTLRHEFVHLGDPNTPLHKLKVTDSPYYYPGLKDVDKVPEVAAAIAAADELGKKFGLIRNSVLWADLIAAVTVFGVTEQAAPMLKIPAALGAGAFAFLGGILATYPIYKPSSERHDEAVTERDYLSYVYRPQEIYTERMLEENPGKRMVDLKVSSYAERFHSRVKDKRNVSSLYIR